jgi:hypothetical protein
MSLIQYQEATYAMRLREQLELAGCEARVAATVSRAVGELIDHMKRSEVDLQRQMKEIERRTSTTAAGQRGNARDVLDRLVVVTVIVMAVTITAGMLFSMFR